MPGDDLFFHKTAPGGRHPDRVAEEYAEIAKQYKPESSQARAARELKEGADFFKERGLSHSTRVEKGAHLDNQVQMTPMGGWARSKAPSNSRGPLCAIMPANQAHTSSAPQAHKAMFKSRSATELAPREGGPPTPSVASLRATARSQGRRRPAGVHEPRFPGASHFERPSTDTKNLKEGLGGHHMYSPTYFSEHGKPVEGLSAEERLPYGIGWSNPYLNHFQHRRPQGGFYAGSSHSQPKITGADRRTNLPVLGCLPGLGLIQDDG